MGLNIGILAVKKLFGSFDGDGLDIIYVYASAVITFSGVSFSIFVCKDRAHSQHGCV